jgi:hypothetical protein
MLLADGRVENLNGAVDELVEARLLNRLLAQTEITFFQFNDQIVVESPEAPMALPQAARFGKDHRDTGGVLRQRAQLSSATLSVVGANAR